MSKTQMDLSPKEITRKQDITSWLEGDVTQLSARERSLYQKRKSAIEDYFKTDLSVEEIASRHRLSSDDVLEQMAIQCLTRHEDGQPWGFRALLPDAIVPEKEIRSSLTEQNASSVASEVSASNEPVQVPAEIADESNELAQMPIEVAENNDKEKTLKREAIRLTTEVNTNADLQVEPTTEIGDDPEGDSSQIEASETNIEITETPVVEQGEPVDEQAEIDVPTTKLEHPANDTLEVSSDEVEIDVPTTKLEHPANDTLEVSSDEQEQPTPEVLETSEREAGHNDVVLDKTLIEATQTVLPKSEKVSDLTEADEIASAAESANAAQTGEQPVRRGEASPPAISPEPAPAAEKPLVLAQNLTNATQASSEQNSDITIIDTTAEVANEARPALSPEVLRRNSRQLAAAQLLVAPLQSLIEGGRYRLTGKRVVVKRAVFRRWTRQVKKQKHRKWLQIVSAITVVALLVIISLPLIAGVVGYNAYNNIKEVANDGVTNLMAIKNLLPADKNDLTSVLDTKKLADANTSLGKAQIDFLQLQEMVNRSDIESILQQFAPQYSSQLGMARQLVQVALDVTYMGQELIGVADIGANIVHGSPLASSKPLLSADDIHEIEAVLVHAQYYIGDISMRMSQVDLAKLPLGNATQKAELTHYLNMLPPLQDQITQVQGMIGPLGWLLGAGSTRHFLVQTLDRGELRPSGGFEGQYGILTLQGGKMSPFSLTDIAKLDYGGNGAELGTLPPAQYSWMNFGNFGVRDANLSADFPTTAQLVMRYFEQEGGGPVDGVIQITPVIIKQFLHITGPLHVSEYNDTVTEQNLEDKLHAYQQDSRLINKQQDVSGTDTHQTRKAFTNLVGKLLLDRVKQLSVKQLMDFGKLLLDDLKTRDMQVYFTNTQAEQWLSENSYSGAMPRFTNGTDGFMVVQANISISKAAQYVKTSFDDQVTLDSKGGATHHLTITLNYQRNGRPIYGFTSYADYLRVYAPANAQLISAYGFNTGKTLCTPTSKATSTTGTKSGGSGSTSGSNPPKDTSGSYVDTGFTIYGCGNYYHSYPDTDNRYCPNGNYQTGYNGMQGKPWAVQELGQPTQTKSDLAGYKMWGGMTLTPQDCISTITLDWYVPHVVQNKAGQPPYQMVVGHQAGWSNAVQVSVNTSALKGVKHFSYKKTINTDTLISLPSRPLPPSQQKPGTPTPVATPTTTKKP